MIIPGPYPPMPLSHVEEVACLYLCLCPPSLGDSPLACFRGVSFLWSFLWRLRVAVFPLCFGCTCSGLPVLASRFVLCFRFSVCVLLSCGCFFCLFRVSPDWVATNSFCCMFLSLLRHSGFLPLCPWQIFFVVVSVGLLPFRCCFAVLGMVRRKSGWRICVLPFGCGVLCFGVFDFNSHATACVHVEVFLTMAYSHVRTDLRA